MLTRGKIGRWRAPWAVHTVPEIDMIEFLLVWYRPAPLEEEDMAGARRSLSAALGRWRSMGMPVASDRDGARCYDAAEVFNFAVAAGVQGKDPYWLDHLAAAHAEMIRSFHGPAEGREGAPDVADLAPRRFHVALRRDYDLSDFAPGSRVRLRLPIPIADANLELESLCFTVPDGSRHRRDPHRLEVQLTLATPGVVQLGCEARFLACPDLGQEEALSEDAFRLYTEPRENLIIVSPAIRRLAEDVGGEERDATALALRFYDHINSNYLLGRVPYHAIDRDRPTDWPLDQGWFDCQLGSALLCALCRARGIPARLVSGYQLYASNLAHHYWAQVWIGGRWLSFDSLGWAVAQTAPQDGWDRVFAGQLDYRMKVQIMPETFTGPSSLKLSPIWHNLAQRDGRGLSNRFTDASTNRLLYRDHLEIISADHSRGEHS